jgi:hypothetical protein
MHVRPEIGLTNSNSGIEPPSQFWGLILGELLVMFGGRLASIPESLVQGCLSLADVGLACADLEALQLGPAKDRS